MFLQQLKLPNIIKLQKVIRSTNNKDIYLVFEHMKVDLHTIIRQNGKSINLEEGHKQYIIHQISTAIYLLHTCNLIHRDLKPSNILIDQNCTAKLCDFGLVRLIEQPQIRDAVVMTDYIATRWYQAPQLLLGCPDYSKQIDIWALGCLIGELILFKPMFPGTSTINQIQQIVAWTGPPSQTEVQHISSNLNPAIVKLLNSRRQYNGAQFFCRRAYPLFLDLISKMLQFDPRKRLTIMDVLKHEYISQFYNQKQLRQIRNCKLKTKLPINNNKRLALNNYRQLIYTEINQKKSSVLTIIGINCNIRESNSHIKSKEKREESKSIKKHMQKVEEQTQDQYLCSSRIVLWNLQQYICKDQSRPLRKDANIQMQPSRGNSTKKDVMICSKSINKNTSLSKKKQNDPSALQTHDINIRDVIGLKALAKIRSCSEKQDKLKRTIILQSKPCKRILISTCYVNDKISHKASSKSKIARL